MSGALLVVSNGGTLRYEIGREGRDGLLYPRKQGDRIERFSPLPPLASPDLVVAMPEVQPGPMPTWGCKACGWTGDDPVISIGPVSGVIFKCACGGFLHRLAPGAPPDCPTLEEAVRENIRAFLDQSVQLRDGDRDAQDGARMARAEAQLLQSLLKQAGLPPVIYAEPRRIHDAE